MKIKEKRGISPVIGAVLLVLITFMAIGIIWTFVKPMVSDSLEGGGSCFKMRDHAEIVDSEFTCYNTTHTSVMIKRSFEEFEISGFIVSVTYGSESETYRLKDGGNITSDIKMFDVSPTIEIPQAGGSKTYVFNRPDGTNADLAIIDKTSKTCEMGSYKIPEC